MPETRYRIEGITPLRGEVTLSGAKNAALPAMCVALLVKGEVTLRNVPDIADVHSLLEIFSFLNVEHSFEEHVLRMNASGMQNRDIPHNLVCKFRASILLLGPLLSRFGEVTMAYPGGCVLGKRPVDAHVDGLVQLGVENLSTEETVHLRGHVGSGEVVLSEFSVTATENVLLAAAGSKGSDVQVRIAAAEPHVQDLCLCLQRFGASIEGTGTHDLSIRGNALHGGEHTVTSDYLEAGFFALAGVLTGGDLHIRGVRTEQLHSFLKALTRLQAPWEISGDGVLRVWSAGPLQACVVRTNIFPGFPTDLQAAFGVAMTQAHGVSRIFERMFEGRFGYLFELEKMGAHIEILNAHEALIIGPTPLRGRTVTSNDIRAGGAMVLAALCSRGETLITDVQYIERGYEGLEKKLKLLGASIHTESIRPSTGSGRSEHVEERSVEREVAPGVESGRAYPEVSRRHHRELREFAGVAHGIPGK